ncbi:MAG: D-glycerate dehydrogenase [Candidatus Uhrbacteria bacterium]|nr:D-glycerate dehydrogenase [Candidatus Uhrbacteria bacterium]
MPYKLFVTRSIPDVGIKLLQANKNVSLEIYERDQQIPRRELLKRVHGKDIILSILTEKIDKEVMDAAGPQLKMIANYAVGFDNIDLKEAAKRGIVVTNTPHERVNESVAEHTIALLFALTHRIVETDAFTRAGKYHAWGPKLLLGTDLVGKTIGIIGTGRIGSSVVKRLYDGFGMKVLYTDVVRNMDLEKITKAKYRTLPKLLAESDFVSIHVPLLKSTQHLIAAKQFKMMKPTAFIINTARGPIIDEHALIEALRHKTIAGAGLDVYEFEPLIAMNPKDIKELRQMKNVVLTPHTASATIEARQAMSETAAKNILTFIRGKAPPNAVRT